ncbi:MAG: response regulator [Pseudomonadota bacterium]
MDIGKRQRQLEQLRTSMQDDFALRVIGAAAAIAMTAVTLQQPVLMLWLVLLLLCEYCFKHAFDRLGHGQSLSDLTLGVICVVNSIAFLAPALALWQTGETYAMVATLIYICAGLLNIGMVRAAYLPAALASAAVYLILLMYLAHTFFIETGDTLRLATGLVGIAGMMLYCLLAILAHNRLLNRLSDAESEAQAASDAKSRFLAALSHEIRTPLNGMLGVGQLLTDRPELSRDPSYLSLLMKSGQSLRALLDDALDLAKIEAGERRIHRQRASLRDEVETACALFAPIAESKQIEFSCDLERLPGTAEFDLTQVRQILRNVVSNAVKFTSEGRVCVTADVERTPAATFLRVTVRDTGPGFSPEMLQRPFTPFHQGRDRSDPSSAPVATASTGLGLSITEELVEAAGGTLEVGNNDGVGAYVRLSYPIRLVRAGARGTDVTPQISSGPEGAHILVVDDVATNRFIAIQLLNAAGMTTSEAEDCAEALALIARSRPDAVLLDIHMPHVCGHTTLRRIRAQNADLAVLAMTADAVARDRDSCIAEGFDGYVPKPVDQTQLLSELDRALQSRAGQTTAEDRRALA